MGADPTAFSEAAQLLECKTGSDLAAELASASAPNRRLLVNVTHLVAATSAWLDVEQLSLALGTGRGAQFKAGLLRWALGEEDATNVDP